ncbi:MAG: hypothetical protein AB7S94_02300 [Simkaniaceae bacterium]
MPTPIPSERLPEVAPTVTHQSLLEPSQLRSQAAPPRDSLEMHDSGFCSWISDAFWYVIDCINVVYDTVVLFFWNVLARIGIVNPPDAPNPQPVIVPFVERAALIKGKFDGLSPLEQVSTLREISCRWTYEQGERQGLIHELKDKLSVELRDALIDFAKAKCFVGSDITPENVAEYLVRMNPESYNLFLKGVDLFPGFAQFTVETLALGWYFEDTLKGEGKPASQEEAHLVALHWIAEARPHPRFENDPINEGWVDAQFGVAKGKLTPADRTLLLEAYTIHQRVDFQQLMGAQIAADYKNGTVKTLLARVPGFDAARREDADYLQGVYESLSPLQVAKMNEDFYAQNVRVKDQWDGRFEAWLRDVKRNDRVFGEVLTIAFSHVPSKVKEVCEEMLADDNTHRAQFIAANPQWFRNFLETLVRGKIEAAFPAKRDEDSPALIELRLQELWEAKQKEENFDGEATKEEPFKQALIPQVTREVEANLRQEIREGLEKAGWTLENGAILDLIDREEAATIKAAIRAHMPR